MSEHPRFHPQCLERLQRIFLFSLFQVLLIAPSGAEERRIDFSGVAGKVSQIMEGAVAEYRLPGLQVAVVFDTQIVFSNAIGYADLEKQIPATTETVFRVASITKLITATALVKLAEAGALRLDDPVSKYLPTYTPYSRFKGSQPTTLGQLATHMSGLPRSSYSSFHADVAAFLRVTQGQRPAPRPVRTKAQFIESLRNLELQYPPNELYGHYSNLGFTILGLALEEASGQSFDEYASASILNPLKMTHSGFHPPSGKNSRLAVGYVYSDTGSEPIITPIRKPDFAVFAGGMYSTADDLCRFLSLQFQDEAPGGEQIISADGLRMMHWTSMDWAFHWDSNNPSLSHGGGVPGFGAYVIIIPGLKLGVAALTNTMNTLDAANPTQSAAREIMQVVKEAVVSAGAVKHFDVDSVDIDKYVGTYILGKEEATITISKAGADLIYAIKEYPKLGGTILPMAPDQFYFEADSSKTYSVIFETDEHGNAQALLTGFHRFRIKD